MNYQLETTQEFLSGNVRKKYSLYEQLEGYDREKEELEKIVPTDVSIAHISIPLGVQWVPSFFYERWIEEQFQLQTEVKYYPELSYWTIRITGGSRTNYHNYTSCAFTWIDPEEIESQRIEAIDLVRKAINNESVTISLSVRTEKGKTRKKSPRLTKDCIAKMQLLKEGWERWAKENHGKVLERIYNDEFNGVRYPSWEGAGKVLSLEGMSDLWKNRLEKRQYQKDAIARTLSGNTLLGLGVGLGKTICACGAVGVRYLLGVCRKALIVVQKSTLSGFAQTFREAYPQIPLYVATVSDLSKKKRYQFLAGIAFRDTGVWIMSHDSFDAIGVRAETEVEFALERLRSIEREIEVVKVSMSKKQDTQHCSRLRRLLETKRLRYERRLIELGDTYDIGLRFEDLGVEYLVIDECDRYKNDEIVTRMEGLAGVCTANSNRASTFSIKCSWMNRRFDESALLFMTGTPEPDNWLGGIFVYQRYLQPSALRECGIDSFDTWARSFTRFSHDIEVKASGMVQQTDRLAELINVPELGRMWIGGVCHIVRYEWIENQIPESERRPEMEFIEVACSPTEIQSIISEWLVMRDREVRSLRPMVIPKYNNQGELVSIDGKVIFDPEKGEPIVSFSRYMELGGDQTLPKIKAIVDGFYPICHESRCNAVAPQLLPVNSLRMIGLPISPPVEEGQKIAEAVRNIIAEYDHGETLQMVFCDIGVAGGTSRFSIYDWMADRLVEAGIPRERIAFVQLAKNECEFDAIIDRARKTGSDSIDVLFSSTQKGGVGLNVQDRLRVLHCIDIPMKPSLIEQRIGRAHRSGNRCQKIKVYQYFTQGSGGNNHGGDAYLFQINNTKNRAKEVFWKNDPQLRTIADDTSRVAYLSLMAQACGGEEFFEYCKLAEETRKLKISKVDMERDLARWRSNRDRLIREIDRLEGEIDEIVAASERVKFKVAGCTGKSFCVEIDGETIKGVKSAEKALRDRVDALSNQCLKSNGRSLSKDIGTYGGLTVRVIVVQTGARLSVTAYLTDSDFSREFSWVKSPGLLAKKMEEAIVSLSNRGSKMKHKLEEKRRELQECQERSAKLAVDYPIAVDRYAELSDQQKEMELKLNIEEDC